MPVIQHTQQFFESGQVDADILGSISTDIYNTSVIEATNCFITTSRHLKKRGGFELLNSYIRVSNSNFRRPVNIFKICCNGELEYIDRAFEIGIAYTDITVQ